VRRPPRRSAARRGRERRGRKRRPRALGTQCTAALRPGPPALCASPQASWQAPRDWPSRVGSVCAATACPPGCGRPACHTCRGSVWPPRPAARPAQPRGPAGSAAGHAPGQLQRQQRSAGQEAPTRRARGFLVRTQPGCPDMHVRPLGHVTGSIDRRTNITARVAQLPPGLCCGAHARPQARRPHLLHGRRAHGLPVDAVAVVAALRVRAHQVPGRPSRRPRRALRAVAARQRPTSPCLTGTARARLYGEGRCQDRAAAGRRRPRRRGSRLGRARRALAPACWVRTAQQPDRWMHRAHRHSRRAACTRPALRRDLALRRLRRQPRPVPFFHRRRVRLARSLAVGRLTAAALRRPRVGARWRDGRAPPWALATGVGLPCRNPDRSGVPGCSTR